MMLAFGFGITTDVENIRFAYLDLDQSPASRAYLAAFEGSRYFVRHAPAQTPEELQLRLKSHEIEVALEVEPNFGRNLGKGDVGEITAWVDGAPTNRAESLRQYLVGVHNNFLKEQLRSSPGVFPGQAAVDDRDPLRLQPDVRERLRHRAQRAGHPADPDPGDPDGGEHRPREGAGLDHQLLRHTDPAARVPAGQAVAVHRHRHDQLRGAPALMAVVVFGVPLKGSGWMLTVCTLLYVTATTALGMLVSTFTSSQVAAVFITAILTILPTTQFSGLLQPVSTLDGSARVFGTLWPTTYYMHASVGAFTKGLGADGLLMDALALAAFIPVLIGLSVAGLPRQEK